MHNILKNYWQRIHNRFFVVGNIDDRVDSAESENVTDAIGPVMRMAVKVIAGVFIAFLLWVAFAPLDSAAIAPGSVVLNGSRKTIQHLEGGIITEILVKDGDIVASGQPLIYLNNTQETAQNGILMKQLLTAKANESRLIAEREDEVKINFDPFLLNAKDIETRDQLIQSQEKLFETKKSALKTKIDMLQQRIMQSNEQIKSLIYQSEEVDKQQALIEEEITTTKQLLAKQLVEKSRLLALQRGQSELKETKEKYTSEAATARASISATQIEIINVQSEYLKEVMTELKETQQEIASLQEKIEASSDMLSRTVITAPQAGKITAMKYHTIGGVIQPGQPIMDIVPQDDKLIVEAKVKPQDIDVVREGLSAKVMFSAYRSRFVPRIDGQVTRVSADKFTNEANGESYYIARVEVNEKEIHNLTTKVELYPGMPAEVFITTGATTPLNYIASPIIDSFRRSFREQ